jgi:hypothetical protein
MKYTITVGLDVAFGGIEVEADTKEEAEEAAIDAALEQAAQLYRDAYVIDSIEEGWEDDAEGEGEE